MKKEIKSLEEQLEDEKRVFANIIFLKDSLESKTVSEFPEKWLPFFEGGMDFIKGIKMHDGVNSIAALYQSISGGEFPRHIHDCNEHIVLVRGKATFETPYETVELDAESKDPKDQTISIPANVAHGCTFEPDTMFLIVWTGVHDLTFNWDQQYASTFQYCKDPERVAFAEKYEMLMSRKDNGEDVEEEIVTLMKTIRETRKVKCEDTACSSSCLFYEGED